MVIKAKKYLVGKEAKLLQLQYNVLLHCQLSQSVVLPSKNCPFIRIKNSVEEYSTRYVLRMHFHDTDTSLRGGMS